MHHKSPVEVHTKDPMRALKIKACILPNLLDITAESGLVVWVEMTS